MSKFKLCRSAQLEVWCQNLNCAIMHSRKVVSKFKLCRSAQLEVRCQNLNCVVVYSSKLDVKI